MSSRKVLALALALSASAALLLYLVLSSSRRSGPYEYDLPPGFPRPKEPRDNPTTPEKVELGRHLFYDYRLSWNGKQACASCHKQELAFTDGRALSLGSTGEHTPRGAMSIANAGYAATLTWANPTLKALEKQVLIPLFGERPVELGFAGKERQLIARLRQSSRYRDLFDDAFPEQGDPFSISSITKALAAFERTIISGRSRVDRYTHGDRRALSFEEQRGYALFVSERFECFHCHGGFTYSSSVTHQNLVLTGAAFENNGLYNLGPLGEYPQANRGAYELTGKASDMGKFKPPSLRNVGLTAPYMHDGSIPTLEKVLDHYAAGGRFIAHGPLAGDGRKHPNKSLFVRGFSMSASEKANLIAFLRALTDETLLKDPRFSNPLSDPAQ